MAKVKEKETKEVERRKEERKGLNNVKETNKEAREERGL